MGHAGHLKAEYQALTRRLESGQVGMPEPDSPEAAEGRREILEILFTPEEAELASKLPVKPAKLETIASRVDLSPDELCKKLDAMCDKGVVIDLVSPRTGQVRYALSPPVVGFFEFSLMRIGDGDGIPKKRMAEALHAYTEGDPAFAEHVFGGDTVIGRSMVREDQLADEIPDVLSWERVTSIMEQADRFAVSTCYCRHKAEHLGEDCDAPKEVCLSVGPGADFVIRRKFGKEIDRAGAFAVLEQAREAGLVQIADNVQNRPTYVCNCCACCCGQLRAINQYGLRAVNPSGFVPELEPESCTGCGRCAKACPVKAITLEPSRETGKLQNVLQPRIDLEQCIGCGLCSAACKKGALSMVRAETRPHVPVNMIERVVRMSIERGNLAGLIVDEGAGRGHRFLGSVIRALSKLPPSQRLLASQQVRSRFVDFALKTVRDPTEGPNRGSEGAREPVSADRPAARSSGGKG
ncbi:MAG: 4Fe-4S binding protein [Myxococcota bacterium]